MNRKFYQAAGNTASTRAVMDGGLVWTKDPNAKATEEGVKKTKETNFAELTKRALLQSYAPASVVTDVKGNILFVHGDTGKYLRAAPGQATLNVVDMAREGLQPELRAAMLLATAASSATDPGAALQSREVSVKTNGHFQLVNLNVRALPALDTGEKLLLVSFQDVAQPMSGNLVSEKLSSGLAYAGHGKPGHDKLGRGKGATGQASISAWKSWNASWLTTRRI